MASVHPNARPHDRGLIHRNVRLTSRYVVISNDLAQHPDLTIPAVGLAVIIQSLPAGASVGIKALAARTKGLSEMKIAAALRELEAAGFLSRTRERLPDGRFIPRTISYNRPGAEPRAVRETPEAEETPEIQEEPEAPEVPQAQEEPPAPKALERLSVPTAAAPTRSLLPERHRAAAALLAGLRGREPRLLLSERDVRRLAPGVTEWLERGAHPEAVSRTLCADLPHDLAHPAGLLAYRLAALVPPPLPAGPVAPPPPDPFQNCDDCDRAFRAPEPGRCRACASTAAAAA
ncbi:helix-turn-helix domain-containing protein [Streptomyces roseolus]|uniref:helix-turn-helix domain-containing protein n=1 Tax=Streptomyces roseolus TaxID=67358 RepID=UPI001678944C|nr:helix-turn-helix domain-containing protein [Streptomyces roseolus]GGR39601.1 DNA-binding protein [Streptomyces roseolus]